MAASFGWMVFALVALVATLSVTELVRVFAHRLSAVDQPGGRRVHRRPTARLGGLGIYWGFYVALGLATYGRPPWRDPFLDNDFGMLGMMLGSGLLLLVGVMDDVYGLRATIKLGFQVCAAYLLYHFGWRVDAVGLPGIGVWSTGPLALPITLLWVLFVTNAVNLIDGLDGLACGVALAATIGTCVLLAPVGGPLLLTSAALAGALLGFLWFNLNPALIFMGDAGSLFVGFVLSALTLRAGQLSSPEAFPLVSALMLAVPLYDTSDAIVRRTLATIRERRSPLALPGAVLSRVFSPDGLHVHHRLIRAGLSTRRAVAMLWLVAVMFAVSGCLLGRARWLGYLSLGVTVTLLWRGHRRLQSRVTGAPPAQRPATPAVVELVPTESGEPVESGRRAA